MKNVIKSSILFVTKEWRGAVYFLFYVEQTRQACLNPQKRFSFCQNDAGMLRYEKQVKFKRKQDFLAGGKVTQSCWGNEKMCWGSDTSCWGSDSSCWGNEAILLGKRSKLLGKWSNYVGEVTQKSLGRCPKYKVQHTRIFCPTALELIRWCCTSRRINVVVESMQRHTGSRKQMLRGVQLPPGSYRGSITGQPHCLAHVLNRVTALRPTMASWQQLGSGFPSLNVNWTFPLQGDSVNVVGESSAYMIFVTSTGAGGNSFSLNIKTCHFAAIHWCKRSDIYKVWSS